MTTKETYCEFCKGTNYQVTCTCSSTGSHRPVETGSRAYRVRKIGGDGYIYRFRDVPEGYEVVEVIQF
jgi:hypothetical protein